jgi:hypothetical protein
MSTQGRVQKLWQRVFVSIAAIVAGGFMLVYGVWSLPIICRLDRLSALQPASAR